MLCQYLLRVLDEFDLVFNDWKEYKNGNTLVVRTLDWLNIEKDLQYFEFTNEKPAETDFPLAGVKACVVSPD